MVQCRLALQRTHCMVCARGSSTHAEAVFAGVAWFRRPRNMEAPRDLLGTLDNFREAPALALAQWTRFHDAHDVAFFGHFVFVMGKHLG